MQAELLVAVMLYPKAVALEHHLFFYCPPITLGYGRVVRSYLVIWGIANPCVLTVSRKATAKSCAS
jgi:hypothetical protein